MWFFCQPSCRFRYYQMDVCFFDETFINIETIIDKFSYRLKGVCKSTHTSSCY